MKSLNHVQLIGHIGSDPEYQENSGVAVSKFSLATADEWLDKSTAEKISRSEWHKIVCFNKLAGITNQYLKKGMRIYISGKLKTTKWQDKSNENRFTVEIIADELIILSNKIVENN
jgi:single-strand DNA-binding protein